MLQTSLPTLVCSSLHLWLTQTHRFKRYWQLFFAFISQNCLKSKKKTGEKQYSFVLFFVYFFFFRITDTIQKAFKFNSTQDKLSKFVKSYLACHADGTYIIYLTKYFHIIVKNSQRPIIVIPKTKHVYVCMLLKNILHTIIYFIT